MAKTVVIRGLKTHFYLLGTWYLACPKRVSLSNSKPFARNIIFDQRRLDSGLGYRASAPLLKSLSAFETRHPTTNWFSISKEAAINSDLTP